MKRFKYIDTEDVHVLTEDEILNQYFSYWSDKMRLAGKDDLISKERCIEDFCTVHWAWEI